MDKKELRLGNIVVEDGKVYPKKVVGITEMVYLSDYNDKSPNFTYSISRNDFNIKPIEITGDWLRRFGFHQTGFDYFILMDGTCSITIKGKDVLELHILGFNFKYRIQYVHQLQNAYFAIVEKELELA